VALSPDSRLLWLGVAALLLFGAAGGSQVALAAGPSTGAILDGRFTPARGPSAALGPDASRRCQTGGAVATLTRELPAISKRAGRMVLELDPVLCSVAETFLGWDPKEKIPERVSTFTAAHFGLPARPTRILLDTVETEDPRDISENLLDTVASFLATARGDPRIGLATVRMKKNTTRVAVVMNDTLFELAGVPRRLELGASAGLSGRLLGGYVKPQLLFTDVAGKLTVVNPEAGTQFKAEIACGARPGQIVVELSAEKAQVVATLASFSVACGEEIPNSVSVAPPEAWPADLPAQEKKSLEAINAVRRQAGAEPLILDGKLTGVARGVADELRAQVMGGATVSVDLVDRLAKAGIVAPLVIQNPGQASTAEESLQRFLASPSHRANMLNGELTHGAVGLVAGTTIDGVPAVFASQLFVRELPPLDLAAVRQQLRSYLEKRRAGQKLSALQPDSQLEALAIRQAEAVAAAGGPAPKARTDELVQALNKGFKNIDIFTGSRQDAKAFEGEMNAPIKGRFVGVGAAQGNHPTLGRNTLFVVVLIGDRR
jgi:uncharacterized protein YkwD